MAGAATAGSIAGTVGATTGISAAAAGIVGTGLGLGIYKMVQNKNSGNLSINTETLNQSPTSLTDTVSKSADRMVDTNRKSNPLSSLRIKQTMNNTTTGVNTGSDAGTGLNLGG